MLLDLAGIIGVSGADGLRQVDDGPDEKLWKNTPPSTCISWYFLPSISTSMKTGGNIDGMDAEASRTLWNNFTRSGLVLEAMAPMSQITGCSASRLVEAT